MSSLNGDCGENRRLSRRRRGRGFCVFHPDAVTAKAISRLSQGVARLSANDGATNTSDFPESSVQQVERIRSSWAQTSNFPMDLPGDTSSFGLYTQRSPVQRTKVSLPNLNAGSKRSFSYLIDSSLPVNVASFSNSLRSPSFTPLKSRVSCPLYFDAESSDSSMLSLTPPRSEPTASSSPVVSSSPDDLQTIPIISMRRRRWRKRRKDWWSRKRGISSVGGTEHNWHNWRTPVSLIADLSDSHMGSHRVHRRGIEFFDSDEDSSEEGPLKKARVTENVFESIWRHRCNCVGRPRRTASLSPNRFHLVSNQMHHEKMATDYSGKQRKPMRFRKSLLTTRGIPMSIPKNGANSDGDHSSEPPSSELTTQLIGNFENDGEGDDERSDATPDRK